MYQSGANVNVVSMVTVDAGEVRISGTAVPGARVTVNGAPAEVHADGTWSVNLSISHGSTMIDVVAVSADGSSRSSSSVTVSG